jgi:GH24 family phage-related lysozyme (muramidase)
MNKLTERLRKHEGYSDLVYLDSEGFPTCGWGHHLRIGSRVPVEAAEAFLSRMWPMLCGIPISSKKLLAVRL